MAENFYQNKTVFITGASTGIGRALAKALAERGAKLILVARRKHLLDELVLEFPPNAYSPLLYQCDVANPEQLRSVFERLNEQSVFPDVAILNAAVSHRLPSGEVQSDIAEELMKINYLGVLRCIEYLLPDMKQRGDGIIAGVSSLADTRGFPRSGYYSASKAALTKALEALRNEVQQFGVNVITVRPGFVDTPMTKKNDFPMPFMMTSERATAIILSGIERKKRVIQFPFRMTVIIGILKVIPNAIFDLFARNSQ